MNQKGPETGRGDIVIPIEKTDSLQKDFDKGSISVEKYKLLEKKMTPKQRIDSLLEDIKSGKELAKHVEGGEKIPTEKSMKEHLEGISGSEFLNYSPKDLRLLFTQETSNGFEVGFHGNRSAYLAIGAGDLLSRSNEFVKIDGIVGKRSKTKSGKIGYLSLSGDYLKIDTGSAIELESVEEDEMKTLEEIPTFREEQEVEVKKTFKEKTKDREEGLSRVMGLKVEISNKGKISKRDAFRLAKAYFPKEDPIFVVAIMNGESSLNKGAGNQLSDGRTHTGLMQISSLHKEGLIRNGIINPNENFREQLANPDTNMRAAYYVHTTLGQGWGAWEAGPKHKPDTFRKNYAIAQNWHEQMTEGMIA